MSIIEQAARRLEELRRSGVDVPGAAVHTGGSAAVPLRAPVRAPGAADATVARGVVHGLGTGNAEPPAARKSKPVEIDLARLEAMGYLTPTVPRSRLTDEFRVIKRPLLTNLHRTGGLQIERANLIMVTSSLPGEGKTFASVNLALSIAMEMDKTVLLVDADVSRSSVLLRLGLPQSPGLLDLLTDGSLDMSDVMLSTNVDKLTILPAGAPRNDATELLASEGMTQLLEELSSRYADRIIIFDASPLLPSTESRVLATRMGQVIMVVEADATPHKVVAQSLAMIESCPVVLPLLNKARQSDVGSYYGYYAAE